jgi:hypothetical protein
MSEVTAPVGINSDDILPRWLSTSSGMTILMDGLNVGVFCMDWFRQIVVHSNINFSNTIF